MKPWWLRFRSLTKWLTEFTSRPSSRAFIPQGAALGHHVVRGNSPHQTINLLPPSLWTAQAPEWWEINFCPFKSLSLGYSLKAIQNNTAHQAKLPEMNLRCRKSWKSLSRLQTAHSSCTVVEIRLPSVDPSPNTGGRGSSQHFWVSQLGQSS